MTREEFEDTKFYYGQIIVIDGCDFEVRGVDWKWGEIYYAPLGVNMHIRANYANVKMKETP